MLRPLGLMVAVVVLAGCTSSSPHLDPWAMYGPHRIPPPPTGSVGQPYYQPDHPQSGQQPVSHLPTQLDDVVGAAPSTSRSLDEPGQSNSSENSEGEGMTTGGWRSPEALIRRAGGAESDAPSNSNLQDSHPSANRIPVASTDPHGTVTGSGPSQIPMPKAATPLEVILNSMPINDATRPVEPRRLQVPPGLTDITHFPPSTGVSSGVPGQAQGTIHSTSAQAASESTDSWRPAEIGQLRGSLNR